MTKYRGLQTKSAKQITLISLIALLMGYLMLNTYIPNEALNFIGLIITSYFIFHSTLRKNDLFSFIMVIYFCSTFPFLWPKGGGFNMISFVCVGLYYLSKGKFPAEKSIRDIWFKIFTGLFILSSILGWIFNYTGKGLDFFYSFITFFGIIFILMLSSRLEITRDRIKVFLQLNFVLIIYSSIASINKYLHFVTFKTHMMPIYGAEGDFFEGGGLIGTSPLYGEHSLILLMLFSVFYLFNRHIITISKSTLLIGAIIAYINVFMSISRSVFLLSLVGMILLLILQIKMIQIKKITIFAKTIIVLLFAFSIFKIVRITGIDYVFERIDEIEERNEEAGGITLARILDGSAFNREKAFAVAKERYESKGTWIIGYGWGIQNNIRDAFFVDPTIKRGSAHSQIFAVLFLFGWIGFIGYWGLILRIVFKSYKTFSNKKENYLNRIMTCFFFISFCLFIINEIKADSIYVPSYFAVTIIWMGLAYSTLNKNKQINHKPCYYTKYPDKTHNQ